MLAVMIIIHEHGVNLEEGSFWISTVDDVTNRQDAGIATVFEIPWVKSIFLDFVKNLADATPLGKSAGFRSGLRSRDIFVLVVFLAALDDTVNHNVLNRL